MSTASQNEMNRDRTAMIHQAFLLEYLTLTWMSVEAAVAVASGIAANSLTLVAFGIDSIIELASAGILVWRLTAELRRGQKFGESTEQRASHIGGVLLFVLTASVVASDGWKLWTHQGAEFSLPGLILCVLAVPIMYFLSRRKLAVAETLGSRALKADAVECPHHRKSCLSSVLFDVAHGTYPTWRNRLLLTPQGARLPRRTNRAVHRLQSVVTSAPVRGEREFARRPFTLLARSLIKFLRPSGLRFDPILW